MIRCEDIARWFDGNWPESLACEWDNVGLLAGRRDREVQKVYIALDATEETVQAAIEQGAQMLITHHPLIFRARKRITDGDSVGRRLLALIRSDLSYYAGHTSFDIARGGMGDLAAARLLEAFPGAVSEGPLERTGEQDGLPVGVGKILELPEAVSVERLSEEVKRKFSLPFVNVYGGASRKVRRIAVSPGSGKGMGEPALAAGVEALITGDMGHHDGLDLLDEGIALLDAGHYGLEHIFVDETAERLSRAGFGLEIVKAPLSYPSRIL